jgi:phage terminase large subunit-like protein
VVRWAADNLVVIQDAAGNLKPAKDKAREKIDPMVSLIMSIDRATRAENGPSKYETEGLTVL